MKRIIGAAMVFLLGMFAVRVADTAQALHGLEEGVLRLHILAASDAAEDQYNKLLVRDALLAQGELWAGASADVGEMASALEQKLPQIEALAEQTLRTAGSGEEVTAMLCEMDFPARTYGDITLPAGKYRALRLVIGEGQGQNWWCVMYPSLCVSAAAEPAEDTAPSEILGEHLGEDACALAADADSYEVRLKCVELLRAVGDWLTDTWERCKPAKKPQQRVSLLRCVSI